MPSLLEPSTLSRHSMANPPAWSWHGRAVFSVEFALFRKAHTFKGFFTFGFQAFLACFLAGLCYL